MKLSRRQLANLIKEAVDSKNIDAGEFSWPDDKPWWANSAVAHGKWDKDANIIYDLKEKHEELLAEYEDIIENSSQITAVNLYRKLENDYQIKNSQKLFSNIADRYFIGSQLVSMDDPEGRPYLQRLMKDIDFLVNRKSIGGDKRRGIVLAKLVGEYKKQTGLADRYNKSTKNIKSTKNKPPVAKVVGGDEAGGFEAEYRGEVSKDMIYTMDSDKKYAYRKNPQTALGWEYALQADIKAGNYNFKPIRGGKQTLEKAEKSKKLRVNPMYTKKAVNESKKISRRQLRKLISESFLKEVDMISQPEKPELTGKKPELTGREGPARNWNDYVSSGSNKSRRIELKEMWEIIANDTGENNVNKRNKSHPSKYGADYLGFVKWYQHAVNDAVLTSIVGKTPDKNLSVNEVLSILFDFAGESPDARMNIEDNIHLQRVSRALRSGTSKEFTTSPDLFVTKGKSTIAAKELQESKSRGRLLAERYRRGYFRY